MAIDMREARQELAARNQSLFRDLNERLGEVMRELDARKIFSASARIASATRWFR